MWLALVPFKKCISIDIGVQGLPFQRPSTEVWEKLAIDAEKCQQKFNLAYTLIRRDTKEDADAIAEEALALLKMR